MDNRIVFGSVGSVIKYLGIMMIVPLAVAFWYGDRPVRLTFFMVQTLSLIHI